MYTPEAAVASLVAVFLQETVKRSKAKSLSWISEKTPQVNRAVAALLAAGTTAGITYQWDAANGSLAVNGLTPEATVGALSMCISNYAVQWFLYKTIKKR